MADLTQKSRAVHRFFTERCKWWLGEWPMPIDDETKKRIERDWLLNQPDDPVTAHGNRGAPLGLRKLFSLGSRDLASVWWFFIFGLIGSQGAIALVWVFLDPLLQDRSLILHALKLIAALVGGLIGLYFGSLLDRRMTGKK